MSAKFALRSILVLCVIILLSTLVVGSVVFAKESPLSPAILAAPPEQSIQGGSPVPGGPGFISVSTFEFMPYNSTSDLSHANTSWMYNGGANTGYYFAPVNLPHGATITKVVFFYYDTSSDNLSLYLVRVNLFDGSTQSVARALPTGNTGYSFMESTIYYPDIDNQLYSYILEAIIPSGPGTNLSLINTRIDYDYPVYLPTVQK